MRKLFKGSTLLIGSIILAIVALIIYMITPTGVYERYDNDVTQIFFAENISSAHQILIDRFNQKYAGEIEVVPIHLPFSKFSTNERKELLTRALRSKSNRIDVFTVDLIWVPRFAKWSQPLDNYFTEQERAQLIKPGLKSCYFENQLYAMPFYIDIGMMYYRRDIIQSLPDGNEIEKKIKQSITWKDFIELSKRFANKKNPFYLYAADNFEGLMCSFIEGLSSLNQTLFVGDSLQLNTAKARRTLQLMVDLVHKYRMTPLAVTRYDEIQCYIHLFEKDGLSVRGWPGFLRHSQYVTKDTTKFQLMEKAPLPHFRDGRPASVFGGWNLMISKFSTKKKQAVKFIKFLLQPENQKIMFQEGGYLPNVSSVYEDSLFLKKEPELLFYRELLNMGVHRPYLVNYTKISDIISYYLH